MPGLSSPWYTNCFGGPVVVQRGTVGNHGLAAARPIGEPETLA